MKAISPQISVSDNPHGDVSQFPAPWSRVAAELRKDALFFGLLGLVLGLVQKFGYDNLEGANVGSELLEEHIAFKSLVTLSVLVWAIKLLHLLPIARSMRWVAAMVAHVESRIMALGSASTLAIVGFALSALIFGAISHALIFLAGAAYFAGITALAVTPARKHAFKQRGVFIAWTLTWAIPFAFHSFPLVR